jgi:hypothetical protein
VTAVSPLNASVRPSACDRRLFLYSSPETMTSRIGPKSASSVYRSARHDTATTSFRSGTTATSCPKDPAAA